MSRLLLVGVGCPSFLASRKHLGPGLRCGHFASVLAAAGHDLLVVGVEVGKQASGDAAACRAIEATAGGRSIRCLMTDERGLSGPHIREHVDAFGPQAVIGATAYGAALATRIAPDLPLWADVFGDLMAEAQAKAVSHGSDLSVVRFWTTLRVVLERGDRFSAVSRAQASALVGQLGLAGRLGAATAGQDLVSVIPCAAEAGTGSAESESRGFRGELVDEDAFVVLWSGSFNTWCDIDTLVAGLERAMRERPRIHFVATGGAVEGHDEQTVARFMERVAAGPCRDRFHLCGWVEDSALSAFYRDADVGICIERDLYERRLGSENRVVQWLVHGLPAVTTARSELGATVVSAGAGFDCPIADAAALASRLVDLCDDPARVQAAAQRCLELSARFAFEPTARPLLEWATDPVRAGDAAGARPLSIGLLSSPGEMTELLEAYLSELSFGQIGYRSARWLWRRLYPGARQDRSCGPPRA